MGLKDWLTKAITSSGQTRTTSSTTSPARAPLNRNFRPPPPHPGARTVAPGRPRTGSPLGGATAARWVPAGETVTLGRVTIGGGLIYTGVHLPAGNGHRDDACLINPTLPVDFAHVDTAGALMGYWPHYANIHPSSRAGYLEWLAGGRGPGAAVGYVFLFFYGLERRIFVDLASSTTGTAANERRIIAAEIERLAGLYDHSASFRRYSGQLLDSLAVLDVGDRLYDQAPPVPRNLWDFPAALTIGLAQHAADGRALDAAWAYAWALGRSNERQRTVPQRCRAELARLFAGRYDTRWPDGVTVPPTGPPLTLTYQGASPSIGQLTVRVTELHDISAEPGIGDTLAALVDECIDDLDAYSRWIGKPGRRRNNLPAIARMPADLIATLDSPPVDRLRTWAARMIDRAHSPMAVIDGHALAAVWSGAAKTAGKLTPTESALIAGALEAVGYGIEPDVRHGGNAIGAGNVVLYTLEPGVAPGPHGHPRSPGQTPGQAIDVRYVGAALLVDLAAMVANADGTVTTDEHAAVLVHLEEGIGLDAAERRRLAARWRWATSAPSSTAGMRARVGALDATARAAIGRFLVMIAALGGTVTADEVTMLTKLYRLLGLNGADVYNDLHALATPSSGPVKVRPATARTGGEPLPPPDHATTSPPRPGQTGVPRPSERAVVGPAAPFTLDPELVARRLAESAQVASILADVFEDTDTADGRTVPDRAGTRDAGGGDTAVAGSEDRRDDDGADETIAGLDGAHSRVVATLVSRGDWTWDEFAALCATERLLPDGALDTINEAALDTVDELLVERHGDHLVIDPDTAQELLA